MTMSVSRMIVTIVTLLFRPYQQLHTRDPEETADHLTDTFPKSRVCSLVESVFRFA